MCYPCAGQWVSSPLAAFPTALVLRSAPPAARQVTPVECRRNLELEWFEFGIGDKDRIRLAEVHRARAFDV